MQTSMISVYSSGLDNCIAFKLADMLAAGCAIVSEPIRPQLPVPLVDGVNFLPFTTAEECVAQCRHLLDDPDVAERMRKANAAYYRDNVRPDRMAANLLDRAVSSQ